MSANASLLQQLGMVVSTCVHSTHSCTKDYNIGGYHVACLASRSDFNLLDHPLC